MAGPRRRGGGAAGHASAGVEMNGVPQHGGDAVDLALWALRCTADI